MLIMKSTGVFILISSPCGHSDSQGKFYTQKIYNGTGEAFNWIPPLPDTGLSSPRTTQENFEKKT